MALRLYERLRGTAGPIIVVGDGRGRNSRALRNAGLVVVAIPDEAPYTQLTAGPRSFTGALSTHAYLHGTSAKIRSSVAELARVLQTGAPAFLTFGSIQDVRYGYGEQLDANTFAPGEGPEQGVPHAYFDRDGVIEVLAPFDLVSAEEMIVDDIVGKWAHLDTDPPGKVHWFIEATKK
ncbi:MAG: hypothetical protein JO349_02605 [Candidatus Eremiobacteraeota bacterium]|nr:hypothetical protein [Candidatus Eremiobacteraeota bacterium]